MTEKLPDRKMMRRCRLPGRAAIRHVSVTNVSVISLYPSLRETKWNNLFHTRNSAEFLDQVASQAPAEEPPITRRHFACDLNQVYIVPCCKTDGA